MASIFVYRPQASDGAGELTHALPYARRVNRIEGNRAIRVRNGRDVRTFTIQPGDTVVAWGAALPGLGQGVRTLNGAPIQNKFQDATRLQEAGVSTVQTSRNRPAAVPTVDPGLATDRILRELLEDYLDTAYSRDQPFRDGARTIAARMQELTTQLATPLPPAQAPGDWVGRSNNHVGGNDLLHPPTTPDFFVKKENLTEEYRIHMFNGRSIRAGKKQHRGEGIQAHPWIRSFDAGWKIVYDNFQSTREMRELAKRAVETLGLQFGAVDLGRTSDNRLIVLEVNRAPGLEGGTIETYADKIASWSRGEDAATDR